MPLERPMARRSDLSYATHSRYRTIFSFQYFLFIHSHSTLREGSIGRSECACETQEVREEGLK
jgi:hypothetical protein